MKLLNSFILVLATCMFAFSSAHAQTNYINYDFESGSTNGWSLSGTGSLSVVTDPLRATNKVLKWDSTLSNSTRLWTSSSSNLSSGKYTLSLDFYVGEAGGAGTNYALSRIITMLNYTDYHMLTYNLLAFDPNASEGTDTTIRDYNGNGSGGGSMGPTRSISETNWYKLTQNIDLNAKTWSWSVYDLTHSNAIFSSATLGMLWNTNMKELHFISSANQTGLLYIDNVLLQSIPEPSAVALLAIGVAILSVFIRRSVKKESISVLK